MSNELKHYGYGIVDKDGGPCVDDSGMGVHERVQELNDDPESVLAPYRVVELYYKEEGESQDWVTNVALRNRELREERGRLLILLRATVIYTHGKPNNLTSELGAILAKYPEGGES